MIPRVIIVFLHMICSHTIDYSGVVDNRCKKDGADGTAIRVRLTTCASGQFTCDYGQCINIEQKCDQTEDCKDFSDEEHCQIVDINKRYMKTIPFFYMRRVQKGNKY